MLYSIDNNWPSESPEKSGRWMGVAHNVGDALTYKMIVLPTRSSSEKVIACMSGNAYSLDLITDLMGLSASTPPKISKWLLESLSSRGLTTER